MSWLERLSVEETEKVERKNSLLSDEERMSPGLTGEYDQELREKAGMHSPPPFPEYMGVEGEYDPSGLAKRVALSLDQDPEVEDIDSLYIVQEGCTIKLQGRIANQDTLDRIVKLASQVDGTDAVDTNDVTIEA